MQAFKVIHLPSNKKQLRTFIGGIDYYRGMWKHRSDVLTPFTQMTSKQATWKWDEYCQKSFEHMKKTISRETLLVCPTFN